MSNCMEFPDTVEEFMEQYKIVDTEHIYSNGTEYVPIFRMKQWFEQLPPAESEIIRCKDCRWWDREAEDSPMGYCHACKHSHYSRHWEINIRRTYEEDFFCADAEPKEEEEEEEEDATD